MAKKILFLGAAPTQMPPLRYAREQGHHVITCDYLPENPGHALANESYNVSTTDKEAILDLAQRKRIDAAYREALRDVPGIRCLQDAGENVANYSYFPLLVEADYPLNRDALYQKLKDNNIFARRYFYPLITDFPMYRGMPSAHRENLPVATAAAQKVICLPIYPTLNSQDLQRVIDIIRRN